MYQGILGFWWFTDENNKLSYILKHLKVFGIKQKKVNILDMWTPATLFFLNEIIEESSFPWPISAVHTSSVQWRKTQLSPLWHQTYNTGKPVFKKETLWDD